MTRNHGGVIIGRGIIEKESLSREAFGKHLGSIWKAAGRLLGGFRDTSGRHLGGSRRLPDIPGGQGASSNRSLSLLKCKRSIKILILHYVFEGQITKCCKLHSKVMGGSQQRSASPGKAP